MHQFRLIARDLSATWQRRVISISHPIQKRANYSFYFHCRKKKTKEKEDEKEEEKEDEKEEEKEDEKEKNLTDSICKSSRGST